MAINLGNIVSVNGRTVGSGIASGLDTETLITALTDAKRLPAVGLEEEIELNATKTSAFNQLRTILENLKTAVDFLRNPPGINAASNNIFEFRDVALTTTSSTALATSFLSATASPGSTLGSFEIAIGNLAKALTTRSDAFTSKTESVTEAGGGATAGLFSAGTFQFTGTTSTVIGDTLAASDYVVGGNADNVTITTEGIHNFVAPTTGGETNLIGTISGFSAAFNSGAPDTVDLSVTINGTVFSATGIDASGGGGNDIAAGTTITLTDGAGTSFDIEVAANVTVDSQGEADTFASNIDTALAGQTILQSRGLGNFVAPETGTLLSGLTRSDALLTSDQYDLTDGTHGSFGEFTVNAVSDAGADDASISVVIDGETYLASGLGDATVSTFASDTLEASDYSTVGSVVGALLTGDGIHNYTVADSGDANLIGTVSGISATFNSGAPDTVDLSVTINGTVYTATGLDASGGGGNDIVSGTIITFDDGSGTTFDLELNQNVTVDSQGEADTFATNLDAALASQSIFQTRTLGNFDATNINGTDSQAVLSGFDRENAVLNSDAFDTGDGTHGALGGFVVTEVSAPGANDGSISIVIDGDTYLASGLGTAADDTHTGNIVLVNQSDANKTFELNIADAGVTLDFSDSDNAQAVEDAFNLLFGTDIHTGNITLVSQTDPNHTLDLNIEDAGVTLNFANSTSATEIKDALDATFSSSVVDITINEGDSLVDIAAAINSSSGQSGVSASILKVNDEDFRLTLQSNEVGIANQHTIVDSTGVLSEVTFNLQQAAENAILTVDGLSIERSTNIIDDVVTDVSLTLLDETPNFGLGGEVTVTANVSESTETADAGIVNFVNAFNEFRVFFAQQNIRDELGVFDEEAVLSNDTTLLTVMRQVQTELTRVVGGTQDTNFSRLTDAGIIFTDFAGDDETPETSNILSFDPDDLSSKLATSYEKIRDIFEFQFNASSNNISVFSRSNDITLTDYKLEISNNGTQVRVLDTDDTFLFNADIAASGSSFVITGQEDTGLEGLTLIYTGGDDTITINQSQGIADRLFNILDPILEEDGTLDTVVEFIESDDDRLQTEIDRIDEQVALFRLTLLAQFTALEEAVTRVNTLLDFLDAQSQAFFGND